MPYAIAFNFYKTFSEFSQTNVFVLPNKIEISKMCQYQLKNERSIPHRRLIEKLIKLFRKESNRCKVTDTIRNSYLLI